MITEQIIMMGRCPIHRHPVELVYAVTFGADGEIQWALLGKYGEGTEHQRCVQIAGENKRKGVR